MRMSLDEPLNGDQDPFMRLVSFRPRALLLPTLRRCAGALRRVGVAAVILTTLVSASGAVETPRPGRNASVAEAPRPSWNVSVAEAPPGDRAATGRTPTRGIDAHHAVDLDRFFAALAAAPDDASAAAARARIEAAWQASGSATADLLTARAAIAARAGERGLALDLIDAAIIVAPVWAGGHHRRALLHLSGHDIAQATEDVEETLRMEPRHYGAMAMMASILAGSGRKAEALKWLRRIAALDPRAPGLAAHIERLALEVEGREL